MQKSAQDEVNNFFAKYPKTSYSNSAFILKANDEPKGVMHIISGLVRVYHIASNGDEINITLFKPGAFIPLTWAVLGTANRYFYQAFGNVVLEVAPKAEVLKYLEYNPLVMQDLLTRLLSALDGMSRRLEFVLHGPARVKVAHSLLLMAYRMGEPHRQGIIIKIPVTHQELASMAGTSRETVSRIISELQKSNTIQKVGRGFLIPNIELLERQLYVGSIFKKDNE